MAAVPQRAGQTCLGGGVLGQFGTDVQGLMMLFALEDLDDESSGEVGGEGWVLERRPQVGRVHVERVEDCRDVGAAVQHQEVIVRLHVGGEVVVSVGAQDLVELRAVEDPSAVVIR